MLWFLSQRTQTHFSIFSDFLTLPGKPSNLFGFLVLFLSFFFLFCFALLWDRVSRYSPGCPVTPYVDQVSPEFSGIHLFLFPAEIKVRLHHTWKLLLLNSSIKLHIARDIWPLVRNLGQTLCVLGWVLGDLSYAWLFQGRGQEKYQKNRGSRRWSD